MPLNDITGVDHAVVAVRDLDAAAQAWTRLGFTLSPRGAHSAKMGTGNFTIMLGADYIELFGVLAATEQNTTTRDFLAQREGIERIAFTSRDAAAGANDLRSRGLAANGPIDFARPVILPGGEQTEARFSIYQWPPDAAPAGVRLFACQHWTRDAVWIPELQAHANTAVRILAVEIVSSDVAADAALLARLIDRDVSVQPDGRHVVQSGAGRADVVIQTRATFASRHQALASSALPARGVAGLVLGVRDLSAAEHALDGIGIRTGSSSILVPPGAATGVALAFVAI